MRGIGGLLVHWNVHRLVFDKLVTKLLVNVYTDVYRDDMVTHVRDVAVPDVLKTSATKMAPVLRAVYKIGREINVIVSIIYKMELSVMSIKKKKR